MYPWQKAKILKTARVASDIKSITVEPENFLEYKPGQHFEICMPGENVIRKYSVVSPKHIKNILEFGVQLIPNGALSPKLWALTEGDEIEIRGPIGQSFVWEPKGIHPLLLLGAGSGLAPLLSIYHSYVHEYPEGECVFIMSAKNKFRVMHYDSLEDILVTRFTDKEARIDLDFLKNNVGSLADNKETKCYICGPDNFVDDMTALVLELGIPKINIQSERFI